MNSNSLHSLTITESERGRFAAKYKLHFSSPETIDIAHYPGQPRLQELVIVIISKIQVQITKHRVCSNGEYEESILDFEPKRLLPRHGGNLPKNDPLLDESSMLIECCGSNQIFHFMRDGHIPLLFTLHKYIIWILQLVQDPASVLIKSMIYFDTFLNRNPTFYVSYKNWRYFILVLILIPGERTSIAIGDVLPECDEDRLRFMKDYCTELLGADYDIHLSVTYLDYYLFYRKMYDMLKGEVEANIERRIHSKKIQLAERENRVSSIG